MIPFNLPTKTGREEEYLKLVSQSLLLSGDGEFNKKCQLQLQNILNANKVLMVPSCTAALEMAALLCGIEDGDEVIMPSYTFVSTANAFVLRGAKVVFVDIDPQTMNIDHKCLERAINKKTKAIVVVHYAAVACQMDEILKIAKAHKLFVIEDAAQALMGKYKEKMLGSIGHLGCFSFHNTKNYTCGEGGALVINSPELIERAEIIREKGTNRSQFFRGQVDKYTWVDLGSSFLLSELCSAFLFPQLEDAEKLKIQRLELWDLYFSLLKELVLEGLIELPHIPNYCEHNAHMFYIKLQDSKARDELIDFLKEKNILSVFHYVPLHSTPAGEKYSVFSGEDVYTTKESLRLLRLPMFNSLTSEQIFYICQSVYQFFGKTLESMEELSLKTNTNV